MLIDNMIKMMLKPAMKKTFGFSEIEIGEFRANDERDELITYGEGILKGSDEVVCITGKPQKLSDNSETVDLFIKRIYDEARDKGIVINRIIQSVLRFNFKTNKIETVLYYINGENQKCKTKFENNF